MMISSVGFFFPEVQDWATRCLFNACFATSSLRLIPNCGVIYCTVYKQTRHSSKQILTIFQATARIFVQTVKFPPFTSRKWMTLLVKTSSFLFSNIACANETSGGFRVGEARGKTKKGALRCRYHIQPTVIITVDLPKIRLPKDMFLRLRHNWNRRRRKCKRMFMIHNFENTESWEDKAGNT